MFVKVLKRFEILYPCKEIFEMTQEEGFSLNEDVPYAHFCAKFSYYF